MCWTGRCAGREDGIDRKMTLNRKGYVQEGGINEQVYWTGRCTGLEGLLGRKTEWTGRCVGHEGGMARKVYRTQQA